MNVCRVLSLILAVFILFCSCSSETFNQNEPAVEQTEFPAELPEITSPAFTEPAATTLPANPTEPETPSLGVAAGSHIECYYSNEYADFLNYYIHIPENATPGMPLIVFLHGDGEVRRIDLLPEYGLISHATEIYGEAFPFILLEPNTRVESWTSGNIPVLLFELINDVAQQYQVNPDKIILTGFSRGAMGVWDMISIYGGFFSAAVPVSSPHQRGHIDYIKAAEVPVWTFAGNIGDIERWYHQYLAQNVDIINGCKGFGKFTVLYGCNHTDAKYAAYVQETFDWMLAQERGVIPEE